MQIITVSVIGNIRSISKFMKAWIQLLNKDHAFSDCI